MRGKVIHVEDKEWASTAARSDNAFIQGLSDIGVPSDDLNRCLDALYAAKREADTEELIAKWNDPRYHHSGRKSITDLDFEVTGRNVPTNKELKEFEKSLSHKHHYSDGEYATRYFDIVAQKIKEILGIVRIEKESEKEDEVKVPIFWLHSPSIKGSEVIYEETKSQQISNSYRLGFIGTALGATRYISYSSTNSAVSSDGKYKKVFIRIKIKNTVLSVIHAGSGKCLNRVLRTELADPGDKRNTSFGIDEITREEFITADIIPKEVGKRYQLSGDHTADIQSFMETWETSRKMSIELGINAFNLQSLLKGDLERYMEVKLKYRLPAGFDYEVKEIYNGFGILWNTKKGEKSA